MHQPNLQVVALCDVYQPNLDEAMAKAGARGQNPRAVRDFREILADKSIDVVNISTPDRWHAYMTVEACKAGKDGYVEKSVCVVVEEGRKWWKRPASTIAWYRPEPCSGRRCISRRLATWCAAAS
ncbi:MAG TPA: Gfo/Idh/MocA family oxidoreductase [Bryobacteraceae bacterium]|jgi:predicted dehydrogenase|nr:Gfo/Idh/MocA family oxidoreductase [Bryobacteraceae bacterium]